MAKGDKQQVPTQQKPADTNDFSKFVNSALDQIVTDSPTGEGYVGTPADGLPVNLPPAVKATMPAVQHVANQQPQKTVPSNQNIVDQTQAAYQAMLRDEEARLAAAPKRRVMTLPTPGSAVAAGMQHTSVEQLVVKEGTAPILVESYKILQRITASGMMPPFGDLWVSMTDLMPRLRKEIEGEPVQEAKK